MPNCDVIAKSLKLLITFARTCLLGFFFIFLFLISNITFALSPLVVNQGDNVLILGDQIRYFEDEGGRRNLQEIERSAPWLNSDVAALNVGMAEKKVVWFKWRVENYSMNTRWLVELSDAQPDSVNLYIRRANNSIETYMSGMDIPFHRRPYDHRNIIFPVDLESGEEAEFYLRVSTTHHFHFPIVFWQETQFLGVDGQRLLTIGLFFGMALILIFYNLFMYLLLKEKSYLCFVVFITAVIFQCCIQSGISYQYWWPSNPLWNKISLSIVSSAVLISLSVFFSVYLNIKKRYYQQLLFLFSLLGFGLVLSAFILPMAWISIANKWLLVLCLWVGMLASFEQTKVDLSFASRYAFAGICIYTVGVIFNTLAGYHIILNPWMLTSGLLPVATICFMLMISVSKTEKIDHERKCRLMAQQDALVELSERKVAESNLISRIKHDPLTGCPNRGLLLATLEGEIRKKQGSGVSLILIHLARFKEINHTIGYNTGGEIFHTVSKRLCYLVSQMKTMVSIEPELQEVRAYVSVLDGATFGVICEDVSNDGLALLCSQLLQVVGRPVEYDGMILDLSGHVGVASFPAHGESAQMLIQKATVALEVAQSKNLPQIFYSSQIDPYNSRRLSIAGELKHALEVDQLELHFQPQLNLRDDAITGVEALVRWVHPKYGLIVPDEFITIAEQTGIIRQLTEWVLTSAIRHMKGPISKGYDLKVSVNLSVKNLDEPDFVERVGALLDQYGMTHEHLSFEITETAVMADPSQALAVLIAISSAGIGLAIDDFGTGYSSLSYLKKLPVGEIKIDRSFVMDMCANTDDQIIVNTTLNMSHNLGMLVVAEGVEDRETLNTLRHLGCDVAQGYYICRPMPAAALEQWLSQTDHRVQMIEVEADSGLPMQAPRKPNDKNRQEAS